MRTKRYVSAFTRLPPPPLTKNTGVTTPAAARAQTLYIRAPLVEKHRIRSVPSRVLPKSDCRPAGLTGRLVYWRRDSEGDGKRGEPEGEPSLNGTGIQVFFCCCCHCFVSTLDPSFCRLCTSSVLLFPLVEDGICDPVSACFFLFFFFFVNVSPPPTMKPRLFWIS